MKRSLHVAEEQQRKARRGILEELDAADGAEWETVESKFKAQQVLVLKRAFNTNDVGSETIARLFKEGSDTLKQSWCIENSTGTEPVDPEQFILGKLENHQPLYGSFIVKEAEDFERVEKTLPLIKLPLNNHPSEEQVTYSNSFWVFVGRNPKTAPLGGRKLHTDDVPQNGTFHFQVRGKKDWFIKPSKELIERSGDLLEDREYTVRCEEGDIILINTRLWWHRTEIPCTTDSYDQASISIARDLFLDGSKPTEESDFTNVDGFYAAEAIQSGTVVATEDEMPDIALPRSTNPTCEVVQLPDERLALIAVRDIQPGEWFSVPHSDDEDDDEDEDEDEDQDQNEDVDDEE